MSIVYRIISVLFTVFHAIAPGEWLISIGLLWWGMVRWENGAPSGLQFGLAVLVVLVAWLAKAMDYVLFVAAETQEVQPATGFPMDGSATGSMFGYLHPDLPLLTSRFHFGTPVRIHWYDSDRPPHLLVVWPRNADLPIRHESIASWSAWYPGSTVRSGVAYVRGRAQSAVMLSFAGKRLVVACSDGAAADTIGEILRLPD